MKICKTCGTLYEPKHGGCPKCQTEPLLKENSPADVTDHAMTPDQERKARKKAWIEIVIGVPLLIGLIYLLFYAIKLIKG